MDVQKLIELRVILDSVEKKIEELENEIQELVRTVNGDDTYNAEGVAVVSPLIAPSEAIIETLDRLEKLIIRTNFLGVTNTRALE